MKKILLFQFLLLLVSISGCEDPDDLDCDFCTTDKPGASDLKVKLTINDQNTSVSITIFLEKKDGHIVYNGEVNKENFNYEVPLMRYYVVQAVYLVDSDTIYAIDGDYMKPKKSSCDDEECWIVKGDVFDVRLKYD